MNTRTFSFYEYAGIIVPGACILLGLQWLIPELRSTFGREGASVGDLGIFLVIAYATGQLLQAVGNAIEGLWWALFGGMPSAWVIKADDGLLSSVQKERLAKLIQSRLQLTLPKITTITHEEWKPVIRQVFADVMAHGRVDRVETFNGNYGLNRGIAAALMALVPVALYEGQRTASAALLLASAIAIYRMHRFGVHYARELFVQFLILPEIPAENRDED